MGQCEFVYQHGKQKGNRCNLEHWVSKKGHSHSYCALHWLHAQPDEGDSDFFGDFTDAFYALYNSSKHLVAEELIFPQGFTIDLDRLPDVHLVDLRNTKGGIIRATQPRTSPAPLKVLLEHAEDIGLVFEGVQTKSTTVEIHSSSTNTLYLSGLTNFSLQLVDSTVKNLILAHSEVTGFESIDSDFGNAQISFCALFFLGLTLRKTNFRVFQCTLQELQINLSEFQGKVSLVGGELTEFRILEGVNSPGDNARISLEQIDFIAPFRIPISLIDRFSFTACDLSKVKLLNAPIKDLQLQSCFFKPLRTNKPKELRRFILSKQVIKLPWMTAKFLILSILPTIKTENYDKVADHQDVLETVKTSGTVGFKQAQTSLNSLKVLYEGLKAKYEEQKNFRQSGEFHYWEMELRRQFLDLKFGSQKFVKLEWWILTLYKWTADYGESYRKLGLWLVYTFLASGSLIWALEKGQKEYGRILKNLVKGLIPKSILNLNQTGDFQCFGFYSKAVAAGEGLVFLTLLVLFLMSLNRHFKR